MFKHVTKNISITSINAIAHCRVITDENNKPVDFMILQVNDAYPKITGIPKEKIEGKTGREAFPGIENRPFDFIGTYGKIAIEGGELTFENYNENLDLWFNVFVYSPIKGEFSTIFTDISERKRSENKQANDQELFERIFNNIPVMITIYDPELQNFKFNQELINTLGWTEEDASDGDFVSKVYPDPEYCQEAVDYMKSLDTGWKELKTTAKDGSKVDSIWANVLLSNALQVGIGVDIRNRKKAEQALRESEERFSVMFNAMPVSISLAEVETGKVVDINQAGLKFSGCSKKEDLIGKNFLEINGGYQQEREKIERELKQNGSVENAEMHFTSLNNEHRVVSVNTNNVTISGRNYMLTSSMDITERKHLEEMMKIQNLELKNAKDKAEESDTLKSIFIANLSHEIRTPMTGILGFTELLKASEITEEQKLSYVGIIESSGNRMLQIINDLIDISKIEAKQVEINNQITDITKILNELNFFFKPEMSKKGINLKLTNNLPDKYYFTITDAVKLNQILSNLLKNALKYTSKGTIEFGCELKNNFYRFFVKDTGFGISDDKTKVIFERFHQGDITWSDKADGVGLGLSISKAYVELLGGEIFVESELGKGSHFYFTLPVKSSVPNTFSGIPVEIDTDHLQNKKVLIAEDDESIFFLLGEILRKLKIIPLHACDGLEAIRLIRTNEDIDLIIMDTKMPNLNGFEATRIIRTFNTTIPIIALSAYSTETDKQNALNNGYNDYLTKPMTQKTLINKLLLHIK